MSEYPSAPHYGANYGQPNPSYPPPTYPNQYTQPDDGHMGQQQYAQNYDTNMASYGYNGPIPGFSAASRASGAPPLPIYQGWNQDLAPLPTYTASQGIMQHVDYAPNLYNNYAQHYPPVLQHNYQQNMPPTKPYDEGEVSEGEFEREYAPEAAPVDYGVAQYGINGGNGYMDTAHRAVYARSQDITPMQPLHSGMDYNYSKDAPQSKRQQSGSYSPYAASQREETRDERLVTTQHQRMPKANHLPDRFSNGMAQAKNSSAWNQNGVTNKSRSNSRVMESHVATLQDGSTTKNLSNSMKPPSAQPSTTQITPAQLSPLQAAPIKAQLAQNGEAVVYNKAELRKKAEGAILNLLPLDVRFGKYVEEGIAEDVVGSLFDSLGVPRTPSKTSNGLSLLHKPSEDQDAATPISHTSDKKANEAPVSSKPSVETQAAQVGHVLLGTVPGAPLSETTSKTANGIPLLPPTSAATIAANEKDRTLKMKMDALRKSREERAQKAAAKNNSKPPNVTAPVAAGKPKAAQSPKPSKSPPASTLPVLRVQQPQPHPVNTKVPLQITPAQQTPTIPGLFLASAAASPAPTMIVIGTSRGSSINQQKRPVAADFDSPAPPFKRPFGHSQSGTPLVIDVSEDEDDDDVAMDLDSQADQDSPVQAVRPMSDQRSTPLPNLPPLANFPTRKPFTPPPASSAASTPPVYPVSRKAILGNPENLQEKEMQIEELRKKIAEAEAAKAQKKAQQSASGTQTPRPIIADLDTASIINDNMAKKVEASIQMQSLIEIAEEKVNSDQKRLHEAQEIEHKKAAELKEQEAERKRLRREKIATDLPRVDQEVLEKQRKLEQLKAQMAEIEADVQKTLDDKQRMAEEMERLGQEAEDQLQAQKEKLRDLTSPESITAPSEPAYKTTIDKGAEPEPPSFPNTAPAQLMIQPGSTYNLEPLEHSEPVQVEPESSVPILNETPFANPQPHRTRMSTLSNATGLEVGEITENITADKDLEAALQEAVRAEADSNEVHWESEKMEIENSYAPDARQLAPGSIPSPRREGNRSPSYSPVLERVAPSISDRQSDADYEAPDAESPVATSPQSPPFSPAPAEQVMEDADDLVVFPGESGSLVTDEDETVEHSLLQTNGSDPMLIEGVQTDKSEQIQAFTPYESPIKHFRAFRFHPDYNQQVPGGFRSLTYSHKIQPEVELCPWEMGGACNDKTCEYQHFRDIGLPDDVVLSTLGSPHEFTGEQRKQFCDGLKEVLNGLRKRKIRDFDIIAKEVVAHRARFLGDKSKILMLEGTLI